MMSTGITFKGLDIKAKSATGPLHSPIVNIYYYERLPFIREIQTRRPDARAVPSETKAADTALFPSQFPCLIRSALAFTPPSVPALTLNPPHL